MLDAGLHPDLYRLVKPSSVYERVAVAILVLLAMAIALIEMSLPSGGNSSEILRLGLMFMSVFLLLSAVFVVPVSMAIRAARLNRLVGHLEQNSMCPSCGNAREGAALAGRCPECHLIRSEALATNLEASLGCVVPGLRVHLSRTWARLAKEAGHTGVDEVIAELTLPRRPFRISYPLAAFVSAVMIILVFVIMSVSEDASRIAAMVAIPVVVVSFLTAFFTSGPAETEVVGPRRSDDKGHQARP